MTVLSYQRDTPADGAATQTRVLWPDAESHAITPLNAQIHIDGQVLSVLREGKEGSYGLAFLVPFQAGLMLEFRLRVSLPADMCCRIEVSGYATRFQRAFLAVNSRASLLDQGDELSECCVLPTADGCLDILFRFRSPHTRHDWVHVLFTGLENPGVQPRILVFTSRTMDQNPDFRMYQPAHQSEDRTFIAVQAAFLFRNYFHFEFELMRPGTVLVGLELLAPVGVTGVRWLTAGDVAHDGKGLLPERNPIAPRAAALMEELGPGAELAGHQLHGLLSEPVDFQYLSMAQTDAFRDFYILARFADGYSTQFKLCPSDNESSKVPWKRLQPYLDRMRGGRFLEVGGRGESSLNVRKRLGPEWHYSALDIHAGPNVDLVGDAHHLSNLIPQESVDVIYSSSAMEHFLVPWRFVVEANWVLRTGGIFYAAMPSAWPLHAEPWDFWRISDHAWPAFLNPGTGFELLESGIVGRSVILPYLPANSGRTRAQCDPAYEHTFVIARKIGPSNESWDAYDVRWSAGRYER
jgi:SAM-dependent methyltransferase